MPSGIDPFGHFLVQTLADAGVGVGSVRFSSEARTALAFASLRADGDREFMFYRHPSADTLFEPAEVDAAAIRPALRDHQPDQRAVAQCQRCRKDFTTRSPTAACPCTVPDLRERFDRYVTTLTKGKDASKARVVIE